MTVRVLFFASLRDSSGTAELSLELDEPMSMEGLLGTLKNQIPSAAFAALSAENVRVAVNQVLLSSPGLIEPGDEVAFLPPVTGG